jgi:hypothetical protein
MPPPDDFGRASQESAEESDSTRACFGGRFPHILATQMANFFNHGRTFEGPVRDAQNWPKDLMKWIERIGIRDSESVTGSIVWDIEHFWIH